MNASTTDKANFFKSMTIGTRIYSGFAMILALMVALSGAAVFGLWAIDENFGANSRVANQTVNVALIDGNVTDMRRNVLMFADKGDPSRVANINKLREDTFKLLSDTLGTTLAPDRQKMLKKIDEDLRAYLKEFEQVAEQRSKREVAVARMDDAAARATAAFNQAEDAAEAMNNLEAATQVRAMNENFLQACISAMRFLATSDEKNIPSFETAIKTINEYKDAAQNSKIQQVAQLSTTAIGAVGEYEKAVKEMVVAASAVDKLITVSMTKNANEIEDIANQLRDSQNQFRDQQQRESEILVSRTETVVAGFSIVGLVLGLGFAWLVARSITKPVTRMTNVMTILAEGNTEAEIPARDRRDEIGKMAGAVQVFKESMIETMRLRAEQVEMEKQAVERRKVEMSKLADEFQASVGDIVKTVSSASTELEAAASTLTKIAEVTQELSSTVAAASEQASTNVQSVAYATEEMTSSVQEISRQVQESAQIAGDAVKQAHETDVRIAELSKAAGRIGEVVKLITAIAEQTNLLALNATIEAARAGEAGRGFAVVASEVKQLASQTANATNEIANQIAGMQTATQDSVTAIKEIGGTINRISQIASSIAEAVDEQSAATQEIARNVGEAAKGTRQVASNITDVNRGAGETGSASSQVLSSAQSLAVEGVKLKSEVDKFLMTVRTA